MSDRMKVIQDVQYIYRRTSCDEKRKFLTLTEANLALEQYLSETIFSTMGTYHCRRHHCWHLGHNKFMSREQVLRRESHKNHVAA